MNWQQIEKEIQDFIKDDGFQSNGEYQPYIRLWANRVWRVIASQLELPDLYVYEKLKLPQWHEETDDDNVITHNPVNPNESNALAKCIAGANSLKALYNVHIASTTYHLVADSTNAVSSLDASTLATLITLLNEIKSDFNAHAVLSGVHTDNDYNNQLLTPNALNTLDSACALYNDLRRSYTEHLVDYPRYIWLPPDVDVFQRCRFEGDTTFLNKVDFDGIRWLDPDISETGDVTDYAIYGNRLWFLKRTSDYLHCEWRKTPRTIVNPTDVPEGISEHYHYILIDGVLAQAYRFIKEYELAKDAGINFQAGVDALKKFNNAQVDLSMSVAPDRRG